MEHQTLTSPHNKKDQNFLVSNSSRHQPHKSPAKSINQGELCYCRVHGTVGRTTKTSANDPGMMQRNINFAFAHTQQLQNQQLYIHPESGKVFSQSLQSQPQPQKHSHRHHQRHVHYAQKSSNGIQNEFISAPSSPVAHAHRYSSHHEHPHSSQPYQLYNAAVISAVAQANQAKKDPSHSYQPNPKSHADLPLSSDKTMSGCCGGKELNLMKIKRRLSSSYSALDTISTAESDVSGAVSSNPNKKVSECVKNLVHWVSKVGKESTNAIMDAMPSLKEDFHVVMIGLDSAGKSTVLYRLKFDQYVNTVPTIGFNCEKVRGSIGKTKNLTFLVWDVGGQEKIRPLWRPYTRGTDGVIFVVDSCDHDRLEEAKLELHRIMRTTENNSTPLLVIANKQDLPEAKLPKDMERLLDLSSLNNLWHLEPVCAVTGEGLDVAIEKLHELILKRKKLAKRARNKTR